MEKNEEKIFKELKEILKKNEDAVKGFKNAADNADSASLKSYFEKKSMEREQFNSQLKDAIASTYQNFDPESSFAGTIHRAWMDIKSLVSANDDESMLEEAVRGDKEAVDEYNDVIKYEGISPAIRDLLLKQRDSIKMDIAQNSKLEDIS